MATQFEVHTLKGGKWMIDSHHQNREAAMEAAKLLHGEGHLEGVKVIKDTLDEKTGMSKELLVFDTSKQRKAAAPPPPPPEAPKAGAPAAEVKAPPPSETKGDSSTGTALKAVMWLILLLALAGGVLYLTGGLGRR
jgi:hypothetical protein